MPTYEYECQKCGHQFELFQNMSDKPRQRCPKCRGKVKRLIGMGAGLIFKGGGFYATDYRSESYKKGENAENNAKTNDNNSKKEKNTGKNTKKSSSKDTSGGKEKK